MPKKKPIRPPVHLENPFKKYAEKFQATPEQQAAAEDRIRTATAFEAVFGQPGKRDQHQEAVLEHLGDMAGEGHNLFQWEGSGSDGLSIALAACQRDGAQSSLRIIKRQLKIASESRRH
jgi:hypothetical protein